MLVDTRIHDPLFTCTLWYMREIEGLFGASGYAISVSHPPHYSTWNVNEPCKTRPGEGTYITIKLHYPRTIKNGEYDYCYYDEITDDAKFFVIKNLEWQEMKD